jgi:hypothetical protein
VVEVCCWAGWLGRNHGDSGLLLGRDISVFVDGMCEETSSVVVRSPCALVCSAPRYFPMSRCGSRGCQSGLGCFLQGEMCRAHARKWVCSQSRWDVGMGMLPLIGENREQNQARHVFHAAAISIKTLGANFRQLAFFVWCCRVGFVFRTTPPTKLPQHVDFERFVVKPDGGSPGMRRRRTEPGLKAGS